MEKAQITLPITMPQTAWQAVEDLIGQALTTNPDDTDLILAFWALRGDDEPNHIEYPDGTCSDGCVAVHPDHDETRGDPSQDGTGGQDRESYTDDQDRESYTVSDDD